MYNYQSFTKHQAYTIVINRECISHWGRVTHICVSKLTITGWDNGLAPTREQKIIWTNDGILLICSFGTKFNDILIKIHIFWLKNAFGYVVLEMSAILSRPQCDIPQAYSQPFVVVVLVLCGFKWSIWPYSSRFLHRYWDNIVFERESNYCNQR